MRIFTYLVVIKIILTPLGFIMPFGFIPPTLYAQTLLKLEQDSDSLLEPEFIVTPKQEELFLEHYSTKRYPELSEITKNSTNNFSIAAARQRLSRRDTELKIGLILPETRLENLVQLMHYAAQMAFFDSNLKNARLFFYDIGTNDPQALAVIQQATRDEVDIILGPLFSESVTRIAPFAGANGLPMVVFSNSENVADTGVYVFGLTPNAQAKQIIQYGLAQKIKKFAVFAPESEYGRLIVDNTTSLLNETGNELSYLTFYDEKSADLSQQVRQFAHFDYRKLQLTLQKQTIKKILAGGDPNKMRKLSNQLQKNLSRSLRKYYKNFAPEEILHLESKRLNDVDTITPPPFDGVLIVASSSRILRTIVSLFSFYDINAQNVKIYGLQLWDEMKTLKNNPALQYARHITLDSSRYQNFRNRYKALFGKNPPTLVSLVYDATLLAISASKNEGKIDMTNLHTAQGYNGVGSRFRFLENGTVERLYGIKMIEGARSRTIQNVPKYFIIP